MSTVHGDCRDGTGLAGSCHEQELLALSGLDRVLDVTQVASLLHPGSGAWPRVATTGTRPSGTEDQGPTRRRAAGVQPCAGGLRALVEQSIRVWQRLRAASLARAALPGAGGLQGYRRAGLPWLVAAPSTDVKQHHGHCNNSTALAIATLEPAGAPGGLGGIQTRLIEAEAVIHHERASRLAALYALHAPKAGRLAYLLTGDLDIAEDLAQEAFAQLIGRFGSIRDEAAVASYLRRSVVNLARKHWSKLRSERSYFRREGRNLATQAATLPDVAVQDELWRALQQLPYRQRAAIVLRFYEDLSEQEAARLLGCAVGTVKSSVSRGLRRLREEMVGDEGVRT